MARVDKKPTYKFSAERKIAAWAGTAVDKVLTEKLFGAVGKDFFQIRAAYKDLWNVSVDDLDWDTERAALMTNSKNQALEIDKKQARETLHYLFSVTKKKITGARAAVIIANDFHSKKRNLGDSQSYKEGFSFADELIELCAQDACLNTEGVSKLSMVFNKSPDVYKNLVFAHKIRRKMTGGSSRENFLMSINAIRPNIFMRKTLSSLKPEERYVMKDEELEAYDYRVWDLNGVWAIIKEETLLLLDRDARNLVVDMLMGISSLFVASFLSNDFDTLGNGNFTTLTSTNYMYIVNLILNGAVDKVTNNKSHTVIAKAFQRMHNSTLQKIKEDNNVWDEIAQERSAMLRQDAIDLWPTIAEVERIALKLSVLEQFNIWKMANFLCSDDGDVRFMAERLLNLKKKTHKVSKTEWVDFMNFVKSYDLARHIYEKKVVPNYKGKLLSEKYINDLLDGKFYLTQDLGSSWIENEYEYINTTKDFWAEAENVTHVSFDKVDGLIVQNELANAWKNGKKINVKETFEEAIENYERADIYWAIKPENTKTPEKQRMIASADAVTRAILSCFDQNERMISNLSPGFSQGIDDFTLQRKIDAIISHASKNPLSFISSHDIEGWSEFEDREQKMIYLEYEFGKFKNTTNDYDLSKLNPVKCWKNMWGHLKKVGYDVSEPFRIGGVQGFMAACDSILHIKIMEYIHNKLYKAGLVSARGNILTCIDDVVYVNALVEKSTKKSISEVKDIIRRVYINLGYPIDEKKTIEGKRKFIFLNQAYVNGARLNAPIKSAVKFCFDETRPIRSLHEDLFTIMSVASSIMKNGCHPIIAYYWGILNIWVHLTIRGSILVRCDKTKLAVLFICPMDEGGFSIPTIRSFLVGGTVDSNFDFRYVVTEAASVNKTKRDKYLSILSSIESLPLVDLSFQQLIQNPLTIRRRVPSSSYSAAQGLIENEIWKVNHDPIWDNLKDIGIFYHEVLSESIDNNLMEVDCLTIADIANATPECVLKSMLTKFSSTKAAKDILPKKIVFQIARRCAKKDQKYQNFIYHLSNTINAMDVKTPYSQVLSLRYTMWRNATIINAVIVSPRAAFVVSSLISIDEPEFVGKVESTLISSVTKKERPCLQTCAMGVACGIKSEGFEWHSVATKMRKRKLYIPFVRYIAISKSYSNKGIDMTSLDSLVCTTWGTDLNIEVMNVGSDSMSVKRVATLTCKTRHNALGFQNLYKLSSMSSAGFFNLYSYYKLGTILDPLEIAHNARMLMLNASLTAVPGHISPIKWLVTPSTEFEIAIQISPYVGTVDVEKKIDFDESSWPITVGLSYEELYDFLDDDNYQDLTNAKPEWESFDQAVLPVFKKIEVGPTISDKDDIFLLKKGVVPNDNHARNIFASKILESRVVQEMKNSRIHIDRFIDYKYNVESQVEIKLDFLERTSFWKKIQNDISNSGIEDRVHFLQAVRFATEDYAFSIYDPEKIPEWFLANKNRIVNLILSSQEGIFGKNSEAYLNSTPYLTISSKPEIDNQKQRRRILNTRNHNLAKIYDAKLRTPEYSNARSQAFLQARKMIRVCTEVGENLDIKINNEKVNGFWSEVLGIPVHVATVPSEESEFEGFFNSLEIRFSSKSRKWDLRSFAEGVKKEIGYLIPDRDKIKNKIYFVPSNYIPSYEMRYVKSNIKVDESSPVQKETIGLEFLSKMQERINNSFKTDFDNIIFDTDSEDEESDYEDAQLF